MLEGATSTRAEVVGVEESDASPTSVGFYIDNGISSVDNIDQPAGKVSVIYALAGASGNFGTGDEAERLLPELLESTPCLLYTSDAADDPLCVDLAGRRTIKNKTTPYT